MIVAGSNEEIQMDIPRVERIASVLDRTAEVLSAVNKAMQLAIETLEKTAFVGLVGGAAVACYLRTVQPQVAELAKDLGNSAAEVRKAVANFRAQDWTNAGMFG
jgi:hypothetical protein